MPNHGKGGRKRHHDEVKTSLIPVRTTPTIKARLVEAADRAERSLTREIEERLLASLDLEKPKRSSATLKLLAAIATDIERAEELTGKPWDRDLRTWAMVREAVASGEIERQCPDEERFATEREGVITDQYNEIVELEKKLDHDAETVAELARITVPRNRSADGRLPRYDLAAAQEALNAADIEPSIKKIVSSVFFTRMGAEDIRRMELVAACKEALKWMQDAIDEAVSQWHADLKARGILLAREYRPLSALFPVTFAS
jgi:hypothetical protein